MAFKKRTPRPYAVLRRGQKETEMLYMFDKPQYKSSNGIYADVTEADLVAIAVLTDGKLQSYKLPTGDVQTDESFVPSPDSTLNDAAGKVLTVVFETGASANVFAPFVLTAKVDDLVTKFGALKWKDADGTALTVTRIDYKASKSFGSATPSA